MWIARVICSGPDCDDELEIVIGSLDELDGLICDCGYGYAFATIAEVELV